MQAIKDWNEKVETQPKKTLWQDQNKVLVRKELVL